MKKISIIVPVYNTSRYLRRCLESIINQSLEDIEIIVINDCSLDNSLNILEEYIEKDSRIVIINKEKNEGLSAARNSGIELAKGEYIMHIDSDDWIEKNYFSDVYEYAKKCDADIVITDFYKDFDNGNVFYTIDQNNKVISKLSAIENIFLGNSYPSVWNKLIKKDIYIKNKIFHPLGISIGEDLCVIPKLYYFSQKITKYNYAYLHYIQNPESLTKKEFNFKNLQDIFIVLKDLETFFYSKNVKIPKEILKINHLTIWLFRVKYDFRNMKYLNILTEYLESIKNCSMSTKLKSRKNNYIIKILKILNNKYMFIILWNLEKLYEKGIRKWIKKY